MARPRRFRPRWRQICGPLDTGNYDGSGVTTTPPPATYTRLTTINNFAVGNDASLGGIWYQQEKSVDRSAIVTLAGEKVIRTRVAVGDNNVAGSGSGERCENMRDSFGPYSASLSFVQGEELILGTQFYLDPTFVSPGPLISDYHAWSNFVQTHHGAGTGQVPWQLNLCTDSARLGMRIIGGGNVNGPYNSDGSPQGSTTQWWWSLNGPGRVFVAPASPTAGAGVNDAYAVPKGVWHTLIMNVMYDYNGSGYAKVWVDGTQRFNVTNAKIGYVGEPGAYLKFGFYRSAYGAGESIIYWRDWYSFPSTTDALSFYGHL